MSVSEREMSGTSPDRILCDTGVVRVGAFRCRPEDAAFENSGPANNYCFVFPREAVAIHHDHERPFVADPNVITFYNRGDEYRRTPISGVGDRADWFGVRHDVLLEVARSIDPSVDDRTDRPFSATHADGDARWYAVQRRLHVRARLGLAAGTLLLDESVLWLLERVLRSLARKKRRVERGSGTDRRHVDLMHAAKALLNREFSKPLTLADTAAQLGVSVFHLCRVFRAVSGSTLHEYRNQLRLKWSLEPLITRRQRGLVDVALDAGYSSHSHYCTAFRRAFGETPSSFVKSIGR